MTNPTRTRKPSLLLLFLAVAVLFGTAGFALPARQDDYPWLLSVPLLTPEGMVDGHLAVAVGNGPIPVSSSKELCIAPRNGVSGGPFGPTIRPTSVIRHLEDLKGKVKIPSAAAALCLVRLRTSPFLARFFERHRAPSRELEIVWTRTAKLAVCFGNEPWQRTIMKTPTKEGHWGVISADRANALGLEEPRVTATEDGFLVVRPLVRKESGTKQVVMSYVTEKVLRDGTVIRLSVREMPPAKGVRWVFPVLVAMLPSEPPSKPPTARYARASG